MTRSFGIHLCAVVLAGLLASACAAPQRAQPAAAEAPTSRGPYVIGSGDLLQIRVWKNDELSVEVPVRTDGKVSVPLLNDVQAEGLTPEELRDVVSSDLEEFIVAPDVTVIVMQANSKRVYVIGEVARSGPYPLAADVRVVDAITMAGGFGPFANKDAIRVIRRNGDREEEFPFDYDAYIAGRAPGTNLVLQPGDTVVVPD